MDPLDIPMYPFRASTEIETGDGTRLWLTASERIYGTSVANAEQWFAERLTKFDGELLLHLGNFDLTGPALGLTDAIDVTWTGQVRVERIF